MTSESSAAAASEPPASASPGDDDAACGSAVRLRPVTGPGEYPALARIWRSAVDATHDFLADADRDEIASHLQGDYFPAVQLTVAERDGAPVGFAGTVDGGLEMLFVHASQRGSGVGSALLAHVVATQGVTRVDVNEQNPGARGFYEHHGFRTVGRDETDEAGRPYPIVHLALEA
ncbi:MULTISPECIES: GNAT family N-acetyltransferase [Kocuria]|uniref:GNAT family N-acetyltransferase n=1 Tax=Kocuria TaxID=57493 RepID=UPI0009FA600C|nr:GNAT family N-acetyltransferase [Kocuria salsicia]MDN5630470.1 GNAT family N-acetyltransferase [Kocuria sp.]RUP84452.1 GNAT family N-acetyltransferase [Kocuria sp. HSID17590]RUQ12447.1 GNAT family N-acetyltransferase [Kocuria sp. HSID17582]